VKLHSALLTTAAWSGKIIGWLWGGAVSLYRASIPLMVCAFGGVMVIYAWDTDNDLGERVGVIVGFVAWAWALDLMRDRARAEADKEWGAKFATLVMSESEVTWTVTHRNQAP